MAMVSRANRCSGHLHSGYRLTTRRYGRLCVDGHRYPARLWLEFKLCMELE